MHRLLGKYQPDEVNRHLGVLMSTMKTGDPNLRTQDTLRRLRQRPNHVTPLPPDMVHHFSLRPFVMEEDMFCSYLRSSQGGTGRGGSVRDDPMSARDPPFSKSTGQCASFVAASEILAQGDVPETRAKGEH